MIFLSPSILNALPSYETSMENALKQNNEKAMISTRNIVEEPILVHTHSVENESHKLDYQLIYRKVGLNWIRSI